ncbi:cytochrome c peroxidase [Rhodanobacter sp. DHG33]|uniref:cytochrome-c peroxidase n=1 Tax=Rhodanobacter sp. DHG33 TaxID=2775921 RepID=UPI0017862E8B|nr:cytochrome c peroxidase [Rhodanobacter sp. DHG33]MBD8897836.1 cytochrome-c peroxidase [Rhodanobacter sp. DHG33]
MAAMGIAGVCLPVVAREHAASTTSTDAAIDAAIRQWVRYPSPPARLSAQAALGRQLFFDTALSASGRMSCASCHDPAHAYGPPDGRAVQLGGRDQRHAGTRAVPSLRYLDNTPLFTLNYFTPGSEDAEYEGPTGGFGRDGAAASRRQQAAAPLLDPDEMANATPAAVVAAVHEGVFAHQFEQVFGADVFAHPRQAFDDIGAALEAFQAEDPSFHPYTSKFDAVVSGHARFTAQELHGYALFNDPKKGNCASCHIDVPGPGGRPAAFTDYSYEALGVPRNPVIPVNRDPHYYDLGLCGPKRSDLAGQAQYCGMFKTPTLRNVATRRVFFHNGYFHTLDAMMHFYVERDTDPRKWYPVVGGKVQKFDDLPLRYRANVDRSDAPMDRVQGDKPTLDAREIADVIAFLGTLDDGYSAKAGGAL